MRSIVVADLRGWGRSPQAILVSVLVPVVVLLLPALAGSVASGYTVAVVDDQPAATRAALAASPYLRTVVVPRAEAAAAVSSGKVAGSFDTVDGRLVLSVAPYGNDDVRRNLVLRQQAVLAELASAERQQASVPQVVVAERGLWPLTPSDQAYLAAGALVFVAVFSGLANAAYATAREWEQGTVRVVLTSPVPTAGLLGAKLVTASLQSVPGVLVAAGFVSLGIGIRPSGSLGLIAATLLAAVVGSAGLGLVLAVRLGKVVPAVLACVVTSLATWFIGGGFAPVPLEPPVLQAVAQALPPTYAFTAGQRLVNAGPAGHEVLITVLTALGSVIAALGVATALLRRCPAGSRS